MAMTGELTTSACWPAVEWLFCSVMVGGGKGGGEGGGYGGGEG